jgi:hypothetical protein
MEKIVSSFALLAIILTLQAKPAWLRLPAQQITSQTTKQLLAWPLAQMEHSEILAPDNALLHATEATMQIL